MTLTTENPVTEALTLDLTAVGGKLRVRDDRLVLREREPMLFLGTGDPRVDYSTSAVSLTREQVEELAGALHRWLDWHWEPEVPERTLDMQPEVGDTVRIVDGNGLELGMTGELRPREEAVLHGHADYDDHPFAVLVSGEESWSGFAYFAREVELVERRTLTLDEVRKPQPTDEFPNVGYVRGFLYDNLGK